jgi:hypothetical protein
MRDKLDLKESEIQDLRKKINYLTEKANSMEN